jgi:hypothetical protein
LKTGPQLGDELGVRGDSKLLLTIRFAAAGVAAAQDATSATANSFESPILCIHSVP